MREVILIHMAQFTNPDISEFRNAVPLGGGELTLDLFGLRIRLMGLPDAALEASRMQYRDFVSADEPAHVVSVRRGADLYLPIPEDKYMNLESRAVPEGTLIVSHHFAALRSDREGVLLVSLWERADSVLGAVENYIRILVAEFAVKQESVVLHSAGVVRDGEAYVFFGHSGAGKSTVAELSAPLPVLSDDLVLLRKLPEGWSACSTPFAGSYPQNKKAAGSFPIAGLYLLRKSAENSTHPVARPIAVGMLAAAAPFLNENDRLHRLLPLLDDLCLRVPVFTLNFRKDSSFWEVL